MATLTISDRYPLLSQRGNLSGKASAVVKSIITGDWWTSNPFTGTVPDTVENNKQWYIRQGPVDMEIFNAQETNTPSSIPENSLIGTYLPRTPRSFTKMPQYQEKRSWYEMFIYHVFQEPTDLEFSVNPTRY